MKNKVEIAVIGSGLTGLTAAFYLSRRNKEFIVLEKDDRHGGVIRTNRINEFTFEEGPNTGVLGNPEVAELFDHLGDSCSCEIAGENVNKRYILKNGSWQQMPMGPVDAVRTPLFTIHDKLRILGEPFRRPGTNPEETLSEMVIRRMGQSFLDYAIDPFILGVYSGDPSRLVTKYAFPKLYNLEHNYGSFIGGSVKKMFEKKNERDKKATRKVFSVRGGLSNLTDSLLKNAGKDNFIFGCKNLEVRYKKKRFIINWVKDGEAQTIEADKVITTTGAYTLQGLFPEIDKKHFRVISTLKYARVIQVILGFNKWEGFDLDGFGGLVPFVENRDILGVLFLSSLLSGRAPEGGALCSVFMGGVRREDITDKSDDEIEKIVEREFSSVMKLNKFAPDLFRMVRYNHAIPQYGKESREKIMAIELLESIYPGLTLGGNIRDGIGMADRIRQGRTMAENI